MRASMWSRSRSCGGDQTLPRRHLEVMSESGFGVQEDLHADLDEFAIDKNLMSVPIVHIATIVEK